MADLLEYKGTLAPSGYTTKKKLGDTWYCQAI
jgi:hypothetical protein